VHLSCTDTNTISKWTKTRFHMTHVTLELHRVRRKRFMWQWNVRHKPCTYLASRLALSPNGLNCASTWDSSPRSTIRCVQHDFWACGPFVAYRAPTCVKISTISKRTISSFHLSLVTYAYHRVHPKQFLSLRYVWLKSCSNLAPTLTLSLNGPKQNSTWPTSPSSSIRCV
jgi:hypothetical protein